MSKLKRVQIIRRLRREYGMTGNAKRRDEIICDIALIRVLPDELK